MKSYLWIALFLFTLPAFAFGGTVFTEDFEGALGQAGLTDWTGKGAGVHYGNIVADPLEADQALNFTALISGGDMLSSVAQFAPGTYTLSFDYLGLFVPGSGQTTGDFGGFIGISDTLSPSSPSNHRWLEGTRTGAAESTTLIDDNTWHHYNVGFTSTYDFHLMLEDFSGSGGIPGDALFDNIALHDQFGPSAIVPVPAPIGLLGLGLLGVFLHSRRKR